MAAGAASGGSATTDTYKEARNLLLMPAWVTLSILVLAPVVMMLIYSFLTKEFRGGVIWEFSLAAYDQFFCDRGLFGDEACTIEWTYIQIFWRSIWQAAAATVLSLAIGFPTAFFIATRPEKSRALWVFLITIPYWVNLLIRTVSMKFLLRDQGPLNDFLISIGLIDSPIHIVNTNFAVQLGLFYSYLPFMVLPIYAAVERYNFTLSEAAADLYGTPFQVFKNITLPHLWPGILAGAMLAFVISLDDVVITEFVKSAGQDTLPTYMLGQLRRVVTPEINAISTVLLMISVLMVIAYTLLSRTKK